MRIVHISDCYLPRLGGIEVQVNGLALAQRAAGHDVHVITATPLPHSAQELTDGIAVHRLTFALPASVPVHPRAHHVISEKLRQIQPDVVHVHVGAVSFFAWSGIRAARQHHFAVLSTVHSMWGPLAAALYRISRKLLNWQEWTTLSAVSNAAASPVAQASGADVLITPNGVDLSGWIAQDRRHGNRLHIVSATRFAPRKRVFALIDLAQQMYRVAGQKCPRFTIAGSGPVLARARRQVKRRGLDSVVTLPGRLTRAELADLYATADVYVQLSVRESFGLAAVEARAAGLPVLGRSGTGFAEFVSPGSDGFLEGSDAAVQARLVQLLDQPELLGRLRAFAATNRPRNDWGYALEQVELGYRRAQAQRLR